VGSLTIRIYNVGSVAHQAPHFDNLTPASPDARISSAMLVRDSPRARRTACSAGMSDTTTPESDCSRPHRGDGRAGEDLAHDNLTAACGRRANQIASRSRGTNFRFPH
jgi:hypothetical protein